MSDDELTCEVPQVDEHCGSVKIVLNEDHNVVAMCWECRRKFPYERVIDEDPGPAMADGGHEVKVTADSDSVPLETDADLFAYVQDGKTAVVWTLTTTVAGEVQVGEFYVHQGTDRSAGITYEHLKDGTSLTDFAREFGAHHADRALEKAHKAFGGDAEGSNTGVGA